MQDRNILSVDDYLTIVSCYQAAVYYATVNEDIKPGDCFKMIDDIRSKQQYCSQYAYKNNSAYYARQYENLYIDRSGLPLQQLNANVKTINNNWDLAVDSGLIENVVQFVFGFFVPAEYAAFFIANSIKPNDPVSGTSNILSYLASLTPYKELSIIIELLGIVDGVSDYNTQISDKIVTLSMNGLSLFINTRSRFVYTSDLKLRNSSHGVEDNTPIIIA